MSRICYFRNKETGEEFSKTFYSQKGFETFMSISRHSKRIKCIGKEPWVLNNNK